MVPPVHPRRAAIYFVARLPGWRSRPPPWWAMVGSLRESISSYATNLSAAISAWSQIPDDTVGLDESLSPAEQAATAEEVFTLSTAEQSEQAYDILRKLAL